MHYHCDTLYYTCRKVQCIKSAHLSTHLSEAKWKQGPMCMCVDTCVPSACYLCNICLRALFSPARRCSLPTHLSAMCSHPTHRVREINWPRQIEMERECMCVHRNAKVFLDRQNLSFYIGFELCRSRIHTAGVNNTQCSNIHKSVTPYMSRIRFDS